MLTPKLCLFSQPSGDYIISNKYNILNQSCTCKSLLHLERFLGPMVGGWVGGEKCTKHCCTFVYISTVKFVLRQICKTRRPGVWKVRAEGRCRCVINRWRSIECGVEGEPCPSFERMVEGMWSRALWGGKARYGVESDINRMDVTNTLNLGGWNGLLQEAERE